MSTEKIQIATEVITPDIAKQYLDTMPPYQRTPSKLYVAKMARSIQNGEWSLTHQGIAFNNKGQMFDGQHRMLAIIQADKPITINVFRGVEESAWHNTDIGNKRNLSAITGIEKREVEIYRAACEFAWKLRDPSHSEIDPIRNSQLGEKCRELLVFCPTTKKYFSSSSVRLVAAIWALKSKTNYPFEQYKALCLAHYNMMSEASQSLCRQVDSANAGLRKITPYDIAARAYRVFDPSKADISKVQIGDLSNVIGKIGNDIKALIEDQ